MGFMIIETYVFCGSSSNLDKHPILNLKEGEKTVWTITLICKRDIGKVKPFGST
jgi:hypothetical protein